MADEIPDSGEFAGEGDLTSRSPEQDDLVELCRQLNARGVRYVVCGGFAIIRAGYPRFTGDIDLLVDDSPENEARVFAALDYLPDHAVRQLDPGDIARYVVCRVADEVLVDLMGRAGGIGYAEASSHIVMHEVAGVPIPFASPLLLWKMKRHTRREKDAADLLFLRQLLEEQGIELSE